MTDKIDNGGPAYPRGDGYGRDGMTLRDYFAGQAMMGICADGPEDGWQHTIAQWSYEMADAMIEARK